MKYYIFWLSALLAMPAHAEDPIVAFAAALAPEQSFEICFKEDAMAAAQCAMDKCRKATGNSDECILLSACSRGWSGAMGITLDEVHYTETVCGAPNEQAVINALKAFCKGEAEFARECFISSVWSNRGKEKKIEKTFKPKSLK